MKSGLMIASAVIALGVWALAFIGIFSVAESIASDRARSTPAPRLLVLAPEANERASDIATLPRYPGSERIGHEQERQGDDVVTSVEYLTGSDAGAVRDHFDRVFADGGWTVVETSVAQGEIVYAVVVGQRSAVVEIEPLDGLTEIEIEVVEPVLRRDGTSDR